MLQTIKLVNFKCFEHLELGCAPLTLLCGLNGMGKSSLFQALLALRQSFATGELGQGRLILNGELTELGTGQDVLYESAAIDVVEFELHHECGLSTNQTPVPLRLLFDYSRTSDELRIKISAIQVAKARFDPPPFCVVLDEDAAFRSLATRHQVSFMFVVDGKRR